MTMIVDVAIGVFLLYLSLALIVTTLQELLSGLFSTRAKHLFWALAGILRGSVDDGTGAKRPVIEVVYEHPLIRSLAHGNPRFRRGQPDWLGRGLPSYIPSRTFVLVLLDVLRSSGGVAGIVGSASLLTDARRSLEKVEDDDLRRILTVLVGDAEQLADGIAARSNLVSERLESWFNDCMARAAGWYKRRAQAWSLGLALLISIAFNANTFHVVRRLWDDAALRRTVAAAAEVYRDVPTASVPGLREPGRQRAARRLAPGVVLVRKPQAAGLCGLPRRAARLAGSGRCARAGQPGRRVSRDRRDLQRREPLRAAACHEPPHLARRAARHQRRR